MECIYFNDRFDCYSSISVNTSLGIDFFRTVNEEGSGGWAQVYARIPFDDYELKEKGALFGVVLGKVVEDWADVEARLMEWVDEFFNKSEKGGDLALFAGEYREKYPEIDGSWLWITPIGGGKREIKVVRWGDSGVVLRRKNKTFDLTAEENKIVKGVVELGDKLTLWSGKLGQMLEEDKEVNQEIVMSIGNKLSEAREPAAGLFFDFQKVQEKEETENELTVMEKEEEAESVGLESGDLRREVNKADDLAGEQLVGPVKAKDKIINWWRKTRTAKRDELRVDGDGTQKRKRWAVLLGVVFLVLLAVSLVTGSLKIAADKEAKRWSDFSQPIEKSIQEAQDLVKLNPSGARKLVDEAKKTFELQKGEFLKGKYKDKVSELELRLGNAWTMASGEKESQVVEVANIQLVRNGFNGDRMSLTKTGMVSVLDGKMGVVVTADTKTKDIKVVVGKGEGLGWIDVTNDGSRVLVLSDKGVGVNGKDGGGVVFDMAVGKALAVGRFGSNIYVLDGGNKEIYKYAAISDGYGDRTRWLKQDQSISVTPVDMAIDSDVWILGDTGKVERFRRGVREQFELNGVPEGVRPTKLAVQLEGDGLAMMDKLNGVVVVCNKETGSCGQQLKSEKLKTAADIEYDGSSLLVLAAGVVGVLQ